MGRFDVHRSRYSSGPRLLLDVQADLLAELRTRLIIPLVPANAAFKRVTRLHPLVVVEGRPTVLVTDLMAAIDRRRLGDTVMSLETRRHEIGAAIDFLLQGF